MIVRTALLAVATALLGIAPHLRAQSPPAPGPGAHLDRWSTLAVELPVSAALFPPGDGASLADSTCLTCHSVEMVLVQPPRTADQWTETINKMRSAYGAPVPSAETGPLARYLSGLSVTP
jgi:cytochrome c5